MSGSDKPLKEGQLHIKQNKFGKKWKRCYVLLYPDSSFGVARLEMYDWKDGTLSGDKFIARRAGDRKVVRLAECIRVDSVPTETGPKENMTAFTLETSEKAILLSAERTLVNEWIQKLCEVAFPNNPNGFKSSQDKEPAGSPGLSSLEMAVNSIYVSHEEVCEFWVTVQRTEAAERCSLRGSYILRAEVDCLILKDPQTKQTLYSWPYKLLRRYGRDKVMFSFEAGRRCASGPGSFTFETSQGHEIFQMVESSIRAQQEPGNRLSCPVLDTDSLTDTSPHEPVPAMPEVQLKNVKIRKDTEEKPFKGRTLPDLPMAKPVLPHNLPDTASLGPKPAMSGTPPRSPVSRSANKTGGDTEHLMGVYSEPKDSVRAIKTLFDPLYSDPVDSVKDKRQNRDMFGASPLYSDLYEPVGYEVLGGGVSHKAPGVPVFYPPSEDHIYDEPEGIAQSCEAPVLYSEVHVKGEARRRPPNKEKTCHPDVYIASNNQGERSHTRNKSGPKPVPAPKPQGMTVTKFIGKELDPEKTSGQSHISLSNSNNNSNTEVLYSQVLKPGVSGSKSQPPRKLQSMGSPPPPDKPQFAPDKPQFAPDKPQFPPDKPQFAPVLSPAKPSALSTPQVLSKPQPHPATSQGTPHLPGSFTPHLVPPVTLSTTKLQSTPAQPFPVKPVTSGGLSAGDLQLCHTSMCPERELSVDDNRLSSIYEDMGML
ncbi:docking protein 1 [Spea bombifrons]|uniref:docking protein 1 n=1 Tax=Spea bombifrons TaxID=233779 RepID=UPI00234A4BA5|nr:docking protein 1 [Spea bombifrons]